MAMTKRNKLVMGRFHGDGGADNDSHEDEEDDEEEEEEENEEEEEEEDDDGDDDGYDSKKWKLNDRCKSAIDLLLTLQNDDGGFATYERKRGGAFLESLNPSEVFGDVMLDYSYVECTSAAMQAFHFFTEYIDRNYKKEIIKQALEKCLEFIVNSQQVDGSYYGSWAVCYTYGTWFALEGLSCVGYHYVRAPHPSLTKACDWLASKQQPTNGGWGEKFESCELKRYIDSTSSSSSAATTTTTSSSATASTTTTSSSSSSSSSTEEPQVVNTSWALLGLMAAGYPDVNCIERGVRYLLGMQDDDGGYPKQNVSGVFNKTCSINYDLYRNIFPVWAIARYKSIYGT